jgi:thioredoxin-related protein
MIFLFSMFTRAKVFFILFAIFFVSCFLFYIFVSSSSQQLSLDTDVTTGRNGTNESVTFLNDFDKARESARGGWKPLLVFFTLTDNESCKRSFEFFNNQEIIKLAKHFVCVSVDGSSSRSVCELYRVSGFPTVLMLDPEGKEIQRLTGKETKEQLSVQMHIAIQLSTKTAENKVR